MSRLLLDTHVALWWLEDAPLEAAASAALSDPDNDVVVSVVSHWEIAIKEALGKLRPPSDYVVTLQDGDIDDLPVRLVHVDALRRLPLLHGDPFDRLLVAQARHERMTLVTRDPQVQRYDVDLLRA